MWDNGVGMTADELRKWATMGISQSDSISKKDTNEEYSDRGYISRFGVGAKRMLLNLPLVNYCRCCILFRKSSDCLHKRYKFLYTLSLTLDSQGSYMG